MPLQSVGLYLVAGFLVSTWCLPGHSPVHLVCGVTVLPGVSFGYPWVNLRARKGTDKMRIILIEDSCTLKKNALIIENRKCCFYTTL